MPRLSAFQGILIRMYFGDNKEHHAAHVHAKYGEYEAIYRIPDGVRLEGYMPNRQERLIHKWIELRRDELEDRWELAVNNIPFSPIDPLP